MESSVPAIIETFWRLRRVFAAETEPGIEITNAYPDAETMWEIDGMRVFGQVLTEGFQFDSPQALNALLHLHLLKAVQVRVASTDEFTMMELRFRWGSLQQVLLYGSTT